MLPVIDTFKNSNKEKPYSFKQGKFRLDYYKLLSVSVAHKYTLYLKFLRLIMRAHYLTQKVYSFSDNSCLLIIIKYIAMENLQWIYIFYRPNFKNMYYINFYMYINMTNNLFVIFIILKFYVTDSMQIDKYSDLKWEV